MDLFEPDTCRWTYDTWLDCYDTACGFSFVPNDESCSELMNYCCHCGKKVEFVDE
jgi:hypothetical protein